MAGYTPVFDSVYHGTLCGRWPTLPVWLTILPMADKHGHIDLTYQAISALTGWPIDLLKHAIAELMEPDPDSRHPGEDGRRLVLIDAENRQWGWKVVNHGPYREKARKQMQQLAATESGQDAERKRIERKRPAMSGDVQSSPAQSSSDRLSYADANKEKNPLPPEGGDSPAGLDQESWERWFNYRRDIRKPLKPASIPAAKRKLAAFGSDQARVVEHSIANGWQGLFSAGDAPKERPRIVT